MVRGLRLIAFLVAASAAFPAAAETADWYRGGWHTEAGEPHVYQFVIEGERVSGYYCTHCADGTTLAPLEGAFDEDEGIAFTVRHLNLDGSLKAAEPARARLRDGKLVVTGAGYERVTIKDPRGPT